MAKRKIRLNISKVITCVVILLLLVAALGSLVYFTNGFTSDFKTFYVSFDNVRILQDKTGIALRTENEYRIDCNYTFGFLNKKQNLNYKVKIVPCISDESNFDFTVGGQLYSYAGEKDLTKAFQIKNYDDYFTLLIPVGYSMKDILSVIYEGEDVAAPDMKSNVDYFTLIVTSYNGASSVSISFHFGVPVEGLDIDKGGIVF